MEKVAKFLVEVSAETKRTFNSRVRFFSQDHGTAKFLIEARDENVLIPRTTISKVEILFESLGPGNVPDGTVIFTGEMTIEGDGLFSYILPDEILGYNGLMAFEIYIQYQDSSRADSSNRIIYEQRVSAIDRVAEQVQIVYVQGMEAAKEEVAEEADRIKSQLGGYVGEVQTASSQAVEDINSEAQRLTEHANQKIAEYDQKFEGQVSQLSESITEISTTVFGEKQGIVYVYNEYVVNTTGLFAPYNGWSRTDYIEVVGGDYFYYSNGGNETSYTSFYDANKNYIEFQQLLGHVENARLLIPVNAKYFAYSTSKSQIKLIKWLNPPGTNGLVDDVKNLSDKVDLLTVEEIKVIAPDKVIALPNEEFDIHYDNIIANYDSKCISYKESFGSAPYGMDDMARCKNANVGTYSCGLVFSMNVPNSYSKTSLPANVVKKDITFKVIESNSGSGLNRKVLLIGDSWTANGLYAKELRNLFSDSNEPMNITLLGTLGDGGAEVGASSGYHEGHGGSSSKDLCTKSSNNGYNNHFYNPSSQTFDFAYYMNYCGYTSVDDVFINLGINDVEYIEDFDEIIIYYNKMIDSIKAYNPNIKIFVGLCGLPAEYEYSTPHSRGRRVKARRLLFHERLMNEYGNKENEKMFIVPLHLSIDNKHDFNTEQKPRSFRDSTLVDYCTDNVHPSTIAYNKIADRIRTYIKYAETI